MDPLNVTDDKRTSGYNQYAEDISVAIQSMNREPTGASKLASLERVDAEGIEMEYPVRTVDRIIEVPEVQVLERIIPVRHRVQREKIISIPKIEIIERKIPIPKYVYEEKIVHVPKIKYQEVLVEKIVEQIEYQNRYIPVEIPVAEKVNIPIIQPVQAPVQQQIQRNIPAPIELLTTHGYDMPKLRPVYSDVHVPIYVPRYIEVPIAAQLVATTPSTSSSPISETVVPSVSTPTLPTNRQGKMVSVRTAIPCL